MIIELVGLPGSGKTTFANKLQRRGVYSSKLSGKVSLLLYSLFFLVKRPAAFFLLTKIVLRDMYARERKWSLFVNGVLHHIGKYEKASLRKGVSVIDQGPLQTLIASCYGSIDLERAMGWVPLSDVIVIFNVSEDNRLLRISDRGWAAREWLERGDAEKWASNARANTKVLLEYLNQNHRQKLVVVESKEDEENFLRDFLPMPSSAAIVSLRQIIKHVVMVFWYIFSFFTISKNEVAVLMYHAVDTSGWKHAVEPKEFERQIQYIARKKNPVTLVDIVRFVEGKKELPNGSVAVTIDDGYSDIETTILPILKRYSISATIFIPTDVTAKTSSTNQRPRLTWEQIRKLSNEPLLSFQSHGKTHRKLSTLSDSELFDEVAGSREDIKQQLHKDSQYFGYPFGDRSEKVQFVVQSAGYRAAFSITEGTVHPGDDLFAIRRIQVDRTISFLAFKMRLTSAIDAHRRAMALLRR